MIEPYGREGIRNDGDAAVSERARYVLLAADDGGNVYAGPRFALYDDAFAAWRRHDRARVAGRRPRTRWYQVREARDGITRRALRDAAMFRDASEAFVADPDVLMPPAVQERHHGLCVAARECYSLRNDAACARDERLAADYHAVGDEYARRALALLREWEE